MIWIAMDAHAQRVETEPLKWYFTTGLSGSVPMYDFQSPDPSNESAGYADKGLGIFGIYRHFIGEGSVFYSASAAAVYNPTDWLEAQAEALESSGSFADVAVEERGGFLSIPLHLGLGFGTRNRLVNYYLEGAAGLSLNKLTQAEMSFNSADLTSVQSDWNTAFTWRAEVGLLLFSKISLGLEYLQVQDAAYTFEQAGLSNGDISTRVVQAKIGWVFAEKIKSEE